MNAELPLRDIHLPDPVSWWPPAPGWWLLALCCCLLLAWLVLQYRRRDTARRIRRNIEREWQAVVKHYRQHQDQQQLARELSVLLRRVALSISDRKEVAGQTGNEWLQQLDKLAETRLFDTPAGRQLLTAPYQPAARIDADKLLELSRQWLSLIERKQVPHAGV